MDILIQKGFPDYELIDSGEGMRLERYGPYTISRPDPQVLWDKHGDEALWQEADAVFDPFQSNSRWQFKSEVPESWPIQYKNLKFNAKLTPFKHTGIFPEQSVMWDWASGIIKSNIKGSKVLNLFGYTGIASVAAAKAGAKVTHVDASKPSISWAKENMLASGLPEDSIRWILDDAIKFTKREINRNSTYDGIIMDPPVYGHGPNKEPWDFNKHFPTLLQQCSKILTPKPLFVLINAYAISASSIMLGNVLSDLMKEHEGAVEYGELALQESVGKRLLSTGIFARWESESSS